MVFFLDLRQIDNLRNEMVFPPDFVCHFSLWRLSLMLDKNMNDILLALCTCVINLQMNTKTHIPAVVQGRRVDGTPPLGFRFNVLRSVDCPRPALQNYVCYIGHT